MSNNLDLDQLVAAQQSKYQTANDQSAQLDAAITDVVTFSVTSSNALTLTSDEFRRQQYTIIDEDGGDPATAAITITLPAVKRGTFTARNDTAFDTTMTISGQSTTPPVLAAGTESLLSCDGVNVIRAAGFNDSYLGLGFFFPASPTASQQIFRQPTLLNYTIPSGGTGSRGSVKSADSATSSTVFSLQKNDVEFGTATFAAAATTATFIISSATSFIAGTDVLSVVGPVTPDATLVDFAIALLATRTS